MRLHRKLQRGNNYEAVATPVPELVRTSRGKITAKRLPPGRAVGPTTPVRASGASCHGREAQWRCQYSGRRPAPPSAAHWPASATGPSNNWLFLPEHTAVVGILGRLIHHTTAVADSDS